MHSGTCLELELLPEFTPNMAIHFQVNGGWPTLPDPFTNLPQTEVTSRIVQTYNLISIQIHPELPAPAPGVKLIAASAASALCHRAQTPKTSLLPVDTFDSPAKSRH
jgi:hypothetical protein